MQTQERICRLCLKIRDDVKTLEGDMEDVLGTILPKINLTATHERVMCTLCIEVLMKCFHFKNACIYNYDYIVPFVNKDKVKLDLIAIYLSKNGNDTGVPENQVICGFCMGLVKSCSTISLDDGERDIEKMIEQCLPGLDLSLIEKPVACASCFDSLQNYFRFVTNCLLVEDEIKKYCETLDISSGGQIELRSLLQFTIKEETTREVNDNLVGIIKEEKQFFEEGENDNDRKIDNEGFAFKLEQMLCDGSENGSTVDNNELVGIETKETLCGEYEAHLKKENLFEMEDQKFLINEEIEIKTEENDLNRFEDDIISTQPELTNMLCKKRGCSMQNVGGNLSSIKRSPTNKNATKMTMCQCERCISEVTIYRCDSCSYQTLYKGNLRRHKNSQEESVYNCYSCSYQTKSKNNLKSHLLVHKNPPEVTMHKCESCSFQTKHKDYFKKHMLTHKDSSELIMYKCDFCSFQTKQKYNIKNHQLVHKNSSEVKRYKCDSCAFHGKRKHDLKQHSLKHMNSSDLTMYKCASCPFQSKLKTSLRKHLLKHMNPPEPTIYSLYKCDFCSFQTIHKYYIKIHLMQHKDPSEITMYKCGFCSFQTNKKYNLKLHLLVHKDPSEVTTYKCSLCSFHTKRKQGLKKHFRVHRNSSEPTVLVRRDSSEPTALVHRDSSETTMHKCGSCPFQTKNKTHLKTHLLVHRSPSEITMYKCDSCPFQTKNKTHLKTHLLVHKSPSEITMYKCDSCSFQTKYKGSLKKHLPTHKNLSELTTYKCDPCPFQTKQKHDRKKHQPVHKCPL